jgi:ABC-type multidrug transport system fused ATPase/permease subunit
MLKVVPAAGRRGGFDPTLRWTLAYIRPHRRRIAGLAVLSLAEIALRAVAPWPLKAVVDRVVAPHPRPAVLMAIVAAGFLLQLSHQLVLLLHTRVQARLAQRMVFNLRSRLFEHLQYLSLSHHTKTSTADAVYRLDADAGCLEHLLLKGIFPAIFSALTLFVMFAILVRLDAALALLSMVAVPVLYLSLRSYMGRVRSRAEEAKTLESAVVARVYESLSAIQLVKTFAREQYEVDRFEGAATRASHARMMVTRHESLFGFLVGALTVGGTFSVLGLGALHVVEGRLCVGTLLVILAYLGFVYGPLSAIATTTGSLQNALASARRVMEVFELTRETDDHHAIVPGRLRGEVTFESVSFSYGPWRPVLNNVSFTATPGETIALVGRSGAGKSTLVSLIGRMYEPTAGRILIDGVDIRQYRRRSLREQIAMVLQDAMLFSSSIADNLLYGRLDATDHDVVLSARAAYAEEFIATLRRGFDTSVGEKGGTLSGGQRQRLNIARAFLKDAPILILDEPTASLDTVSEQAVLAALDRLQQGRTTFVIAHRLSTVRGADRIFVLDAGQIVAEGTHDQLQSANPLYRQLCAQLADVDSPQARSSTR